mmetsp:Transcript_25517/g.43036  ORF Transcript_25517/g.43036 Transcript_25517/m.43036 type:complete len:308 (-) Transcript_25517:1381-2304(-)
MESLICIACDIKVVPTLPSNVSWTFSICRVLLKLSKFPSEAEVLSVVNTLPHKSREVKCSLLRREVKSLNNPFSFTLQYFNDNSFTYLELLIICSLISFKVVSSFSSASLRVRRISGDSSLEPADIWVALSSTFIQFMSTKYIIIRKNLILDRSFPFSCRVTSYDCSAKVESYVTPARRDSAQKPRAGMTHFWLKPSMDTLDSDRVKRELRNTELLLVLDRAYCSSSSSLAVFSSSRSLLVSSSLASVAVRASSLLFISKECLTPATKPSSSAHSMSTMYPNTLWTGTQRVMAHRNSFDFSRDEKIT